MEQKELLRKIKLELSKRLNAERVCIFGSRARGTFYPDSDYDIAVISADFENKSFEERQRLTRPAIRKILKKNALDIVCYTPEEYARGKKAYLPSVIEKEGIGA